MKDAQVNVILRFCDAAIPSAVGVLAVVPVRALGALHEVAAHLRLEARVARRLFRRRRRNGPKHAVSAVWWTE